MDRNDPEIRARLLVKLAADFPTGQIVQEWDIGSARADVAVIDRTGIYGFEIKSRADSIRSFATAQQAAYSRVFNRCFVVAGGRHLEHLPALLPWWWGTIDARAELRQVRGSHPNPDARPERLLWKTELQKIAKPRGLLLSCRRRIKRAPSKWDLLEEIGAGMERAALLECVVDALRARVDWRLPDGRSVAGKRIRDARAQLH